MPQVLLLHLPFPPTLLQFCNYLHTLATDAPLEYSSWLSLSYSWKSASVLTTAYFSKLPLKAPEEKPSKTVWLRFVVWSESLGNYLHSIFRRITANNCSSWDKRPHQMQRGATTGVSPCNLNKRHKIVVDLSCSKCYLFIFDPKKHKMASWLLAFQLQNSIGGLLFHH